MTVAGLRLKAGVYQGLSKEKLEQNRKKAVSSGFLEKAYEIVNVFGTVQKDKKGPRSEDRDFLSKFKEGELEIVLEINSYGGWSRNYKINGENFYPDYTPGSSQWFVRVGYQDRLVFSKMFNEVFMHPSENPEDPLSWESKVNRLYEEAVKSKITD